MIKKISFTLIAFLLFTSPLFLSAQDFDDLNNQADKEYLAKNYQKAIDLSTQSLNIKLNARAYFIRADSRYSLSDYQAALDDYTSALSYYSAYYADDKYKGRIYYWRGLTRYNLQKYDDAISDFNSAITYNYEKLNYAYWDRANSYYALAKYKESENDYSSAIDRTSDSKELSTLYKYRGDCNALQGKYTDAYSFYTRAVSYDPNNYNAYWEMGYYKDLEGRDEDALVDYGKAINVVKSLNDPSKDADLATLYRNEALLHKVLGRYDDALNAINMAIQTNPNYSKAYKTRAEIYSAQKKYDKARADYINATGLEKDKKNISDLYLNSSLMAMDMLDYKSSLDDLNKAVELDPSDGMNYWHRAIIYQYKKNYAQAIKECGTALDLYKTDSSSLSGLYKLRASLKDKTSNYAGAVEDYQAALKFYPDDYDTYYKLGRLFKTKMKNNDLGNANLSKAADMAEKYDDTAKYCYIKVIQGNKEEAIKKAFEKAEYSKDKKDVYSWDLYNIACIYALAGNSTKSLEYFDKSLAAGFDQYSHFLNDEDLETIRRLPQWKTILVKYKVPQIKQ
ncbi:MAG TPA: tetratricopeptide repeat protein [Chitinophagaceae bacterium]|nr:tetratricopeptide repeat protein [Chitinophagaceae bacterium]